MADTTPQTLTRDLRVGEVVILRGEKIIGVVSYIGSMIDEDPNKQYVGLTLSDPVPQGHNGTERRHRYFRCKDKHGIIIGLDLVARRISPPELLHKVTDLNNAFNQCFNQSQQLKQKLAQLSETLSRVQGENQELRDKIHYYEQQLQYHAPFIEHLGDLAVNQNINESPISASPSASISPSPPNPIRERSQSHQIQSNNPNMKRRTFNKPLPPLPPRKQQYMNKQSLQQQDRNRVVARYKKKSYEKRRQYYEQRSNSRSKQSFKSRRNRNISDTSKSTLTSAAFTMASTADLGSASESPVPLSIGDDARTFKLLTPDLIKTSTTKSIDCNESESHDVGDTVSLNFDGNDIMEDGLFPIKSTPRARYANHNTASRFNTREDDEDDDDDMTLSHTLYNEENDLDIGSIMSYTSRKDIYDKSINSNEVKPPHIIHESPQEDMNNDKHIKDETNIINTQNTIEFEYDEASQSLEYEAEEAAYANLHTRTYQQLDEDSDLEIESPQPCAKKPADISIKLYKPQSAQIISSNNNNNNRIIVTTEPQTEIIVADGLQTNSTQSNGSKLKLTARVSNHTASSIPDNVGLYSTEPEIDISDSPSNTNTPSYTQVNTSRNTSATTLTTITPHKTLTRKKRIIKRHSLTPQHVQMPAQTKFNPQRISKSQVRLTDISDDGDNNSFAQEILYNMSSDDDRSNHSNNLKKKMFPQRNNMKNGKRKSMGIPSSKHKKLKKRMVRSRTFVRNGDQKYDADDPQNNSVELDFEEEKSPQPLGIEVPIYDHKRQRMIVGSKTPQTTPLRALKAHQDPHPITLDDFELDSPLGPQYIRDKHHNKRTQYNQHNINQQTSSPKLDVHHVHHKQYYSSHIPLKEKTNRDKVPKHQPSLTSNLSQPSRKLTYNNNVNNFNRTRMQRTKSSPGKPPRNLGSLTDTELKGFFTADNLFIK